MAQADYNIGANPSGLNMRTEINQIFTAILTQNSGATPPAITEAGMWWGDTSNSSTYYLKMRNHTNDGWVSLYAYDVASKTINALTNDTVKLTGNQTIAGVKTFSSSPIVPTPTADTQAANKAYVDSASGGAWSANDSRAKTALNASGDAPIYACRAWVNFNGTGTVAIRESGNVSSITDNGIGDYTVNLIVAMPGSSFCSKASNGYNNASDSLRVTDKIININSSSVRYMSIDLSGVKADANPIFISIHR